MSKQLKATPGPWKAHSHMGEHFVTGGNPSFLIAHVSNGRTHHEPDAANAHLIAAAPALYEALETTLGNIMSLGPAGALESVPMPFRVWAQVVSDALAAARGEA